MLYDPEAMQKQIDQHQKVIDSLEEQKRSLTESQSTLQLEIDKLKAVMGA